MPSPAMITDHFLLHHALSRELYHEVAAPLPIVDYHNHVNPHHLATNKKFATITELWIHPDPYKHRAMRINGIAEHYITGPASDEEKFMQWAKTVPRTLGNPLFHWACLELKRVFGIDEPLSERNASAVWDVGNAQLPGDDYSAGGLLRRWNVETLCTSDDWLNDLTVHQQATAATDIQVRPSLRADTALAFAGERYPDFLQELSSVTECPITHLDELKAALLLRLSYFHKHGCRLSDHAIDAGFTFDLPAEGQAHRLFERVLQNTSLSKTESTQLQSYLLTFLGVEYGKRGWTMQLHIGAQRYTSSRLRTLAGGAGGYASIGQSCDIDSLCRWLDHLEQQTYLPRVILYTLNPADNAALATLMGSFTEDGKPGKVQLGPAWWYNDHLVGIREQLTTVANYGLLSHFVGMTTDSRSLLSFSRHEYFRRILCDLIAEWAAQGWIPNDTLFLRELITNIAYTNSKRMLYEK